MRGVVLTLAAYLLLTGGSGGGTIQGFDPSVAVTASTLDSGSGTNDWVGRASVKRRPSDDALVLVYYKGTAHAANQGALHIRFNATGDPLDWTDEDTTLGGDAVVGFPMNPSTKLSGEDAGEPWLYVAPNGDLLLHMWRIDYSVSMGGTWQSRSTDGGETWSTSAQVAFGNTATDDDIIFATDDDFVFDRTIYAGARIYSGGADGDPSSSILIKSADNGHSWNYVSTIQASSEGGTGGQEVGIEYVGNSTIVAMLRDNPHTNSYRRISTDMGATWGTLTDVTSMVGIAGRQRVYTRSHLMGLSGWWKDPVLIMLGFVHQISGDSQSRRSAVWFSPDRGTTWDGPHYIDTTAEDGGYGDLFWDGTNEQFVAVSYRGTLLAASLKQYALAVTGLH